MDNIRTRHWWPAVGATAAVVALVAATTVAVGGPGGDGTGRLGAPRPAAAGSCEVEPLDWPAKAEPQNPVAMSADGSYAVAPSSSLGTVFDATTDPGITGFVLWHDGEASVVDSGVTGMTMTIAGVNSHGVVVGASEPTTSQKDGYAWRYVDGEFQTLELPEGMSPRYLAGVNDDGVVVGNHEEIVGSTPDMADREDEPGRAVPVWTSESVTAEAVVFGADEGYLVRVAGVTGDGVVYGSQVDSVDIDGEDPSHLDPRRWNLDGSVAERPDGISEAMVEVTDARDEWVLFDGSYPAGRRWHSGSGDAAGAVKDFYGSVIDDRGRVYGGTYQGTDNTDYDAYQKLAPAVYDTRATELPVPEGLDNARTDDPYGITDVVVDVADDGSRLVGVVDGNPVLWTCRN